MHISRDAIMWAFLSDKRTENWDRIVRSRSQVRRGSRRKQFFPQARLREEVERKNTEELQQVATDAAWCPRARLFDKGSNTTQECWGRQQSLFCFGSLSPSHFWMKGMKTQPFPLDDQNYGTWGWILESKLEQKLEVLLWGCGARGCTLWIHSQRPQEALLTPVFL